MVICNSSLRVVTTGRDYRSSYVFQLFCRPGMFGVLVHVLVSYEEKDLNFILADINLLEGMTKAAVLPAPFFARRLVTVLI